MRYIGIMSGTSLDGIDLALVEFTESRMQLLATRGEPFPVDLHQALEAFCRPGPVSPDAWYQADARLGELYGQAVLNLLDQTQQDPTGVRAIGCHGQTVLHRPEAPLPFSVQLGDAHRIAERTGITTVADFRRRDLAAGGQGAPLAPAFHAMLLQDHQEYRAVLNLGGIANLTLLPPTGGNVTGFDCGPANTLLDQWAGRHLQRPWDTDGAWAASGTPIPELLRAMLDEPYFRLPPPKSTGRESFHMGWLEQKLATYGLRVAPQDVQATLSELTARTVAEALRREAPDTRRLLICGGGIHNQDLIARLGRRLGNITWQSTADHGLDPDWVEACAFAWLARQALTGRTGNLPSVTGARHPVVLGAIYPGSAHNPGSQPGGQFPPE